MKNITFILLASFLLVPNAFAKNVAGYIYTTLNGETTNQVISMERYSDGSLGKQKSYSTYSLGGANRAAGGDAAGDFDSQFAVQIIKNYLLAVNAGGNTISVFKLNRKNGKLSLKGNTGSGGVRPVSITYTPKSKGISDYWVVVGNQWNNPNAQKGGKGEGALEIYPNIEFYNTGHKTIFNERNISLFSFNAKNGNLKFEKILDTYAGTHGGPTTVAFNHNGTKLAVATWGIAHFGTKTPTKQKPSRVYVYGFANGDVSDRRFFEKQGVAGSIGMDWNKNNSYLYVSNFNLRADLQDYDLTVLKDDGKSVKLINNLGTGDDGIDEACWALVGPNGKKLYISSFGGNWISEFDILKSGNVKKIGNKKNTVFYSRKKGTPGGDTKDMYITSDSKHMYVLGAYQTFTISRYDISKSGALKLKKEVKVKAATAKGAGAYNFLGLAGFDK